MKPALAVGALALAAALSACANGQLTPVAQQDIQTALNVACPVITALQPSVAATFNGNVRTAYNAVLLACPPNPPPTSPVIIGIDILDAIQILQPYLKKL
jgi:hypothetical protein